MASNGQNDRGVAPRTPPARGQQGAVPAPIGGAGGAAIGAGGAAGAGTAPAPRAATHRPASRIDRLSIRLQPHEYDQLRADAARAGRGVSAYVRDRLLGPDRHAMRHAGRAVNAQIYNELVPYHDDMRALLEVARMNRSALPAADARAIFSNIGEQIRITEALLAEITRPDDRMERAAAAATALLDRLESVDTRLENVGRLAAALQDAARPDGRTDRILELLGAAMRRLDALDRHLP